VRIYSYELGSEPLLGEIAGRWYWDAQACRFKPNRRHSERRIGIGVGAVCRNRSACPQPEPSAARTPARPNVAENLTVSQDAT
jgi:hypothetical protein